MPMLRRAVLRIGLGAAAGLEIVGEAGSGNEPLVQQAAAALTILLLDLSLGPPVPAALALLPALREQYPQLRVLAQG